MYTLKNPIKLDVPCFYFGNNSIYLFSKSIVGWYFNVYLLSNSFGVCSTLTLLHDMNEFKFSLDKVSTFNIFQSICILHGLKNEPTLKTRANWEKLKAFDLESSLLSFSVQSPPYMIKQPPTDEVLFKVKARADENDKPFVIECEAEGEPAPT